MSEIQQDNQEMVRELAPGIILYKDQGSSNEIPGALGLFIWKVSVNAMSCVELEVSLENSENIQLLNSEDGLRTLVQMNPNETKEIAKIAIFDGWKIQAKFKLTLSVPDKKIQETFIMKNNKNNQILLKDCYKKLNKIPLEFLDEKELETVLTKNKVHKFVDFDYPPSDEVILETKENQNLRDNFEYLVDWKRPGMFILLNNTGHASREEEVQIFYGDEPGPNDIHLGLIENHNLASALSALAEKNNLIKRVILSNSVSKFGIYKINLWINGLPKSFIIDDLFPCIPMNNPIVTRSPSNEIWVLIIEKALAKAIGNYSMLIFLSIIEFLLVLTGCPTFFYEINDLIQENDYTVLLKKLETYVNDKQYLTMAIMNKNEEVEEDEDRGLIVPGFGYTILGILKTKNDIFIKIRKVWYNETKDTNIKEYQERLKESYPELEEEEATMNDSEAFLTLADFVKEFAIIAVCYTRNWEEIRLKGRFKFQKENDDSFYATCISESYYILNVSTRANIVISIFQDEDFFKGNESIKPIMDISMSILKYNPLTKELTHYQSLDFSHTQSLQQELDLKEGIYIVIPRSSGCFMAKASEGQEHTLYEKPKLTKIFVDILKDIFNSYDLDNEGILTYNSFKNIYEIFTNSELTEEEFREDILNTNQHFNNGNADGITEKGFITFVENNFEDIGNETIFNFLKAIGYNDALNNEKYRLYNIVFQSDKKISVDARPCHNSGINSKLNNILLKNFGEINENISSTDCIKIMTVKSKLNNIVTLGCKNVSDQNLTVTLTFNSLEGISLATSTPIKKVVKAHELEYFCQLSLDENNTVDNLLIDVNY